MKCSGIRVLRGPDWTQKEEDGGEGHLGTVVRVMAEEGTAEVVWDNGQVNTCRVGKEGKHDLRIYDNAPAGGCIFRGVVCQGCRNSSIYGTSWRCSTCSNLHLCSRCYQLGIHPLSHHFLRRDHTWEDGVAVGTRSAASKIPVFGIFPEARVARGRHWEYGDADGGPDGSGVVVEIESPEYGSARNAVRVSWDSGQSLQHRLGLHGKVDLVCTEEAPGSACYVSHLPVLNIDPCLDRVENSVEVHTDRQVEAITNAASSLSEVQENKAEPSAEEEIKPVYVDNTSHQAAAARQSMNTAGKATAANNRLDQEAEVRQATEAKIKVDPEVRVNNEVRVDKEVTLDTESEIGVGDRVEVGVNFDTFRDIQSQTASWTDDMKECMGRTGAVKAVTATGEMEVDFEGNTWKIHPISLKRATQTILSADSFKVGDTVRIISDARLLEQLQEEHGGWNSSMTETAGKVGKVKKVTPRGDVEVSLGQQNWVFNPQSCRPAPGCPTHLHSEDPMDSIFQALAGETRSSALSEVVAAAKKGNVKKVSDMLERQPELMEGTIAGATVLHHTALAGQTEVVRLLVAKGASLHQGDSVNDTPLFVAIRKRRVETAKVLLELGSNVHHANNEGSTALHLAVRTSCPPLLPLLLQRGASVNTRNASNKTPLYIAVTENADMDIIDAILAVEDLDLKLPNKQQATCLHMAVYKNNTRMVEKLLARDSSVVNAKMEQGKTPLHVAACGKHPDIIRLLVRANAPLNARTSRSLTPLHSACIGDHIESAKVLVENGADIHAVTDEMYTPLHMALGTGVSVEQVTQMDKGVDLAMFLIQHGARLDVLNDKGETPLEAAPTARREKLLRLLREHEVKSTNNAQADKACNVSTAPTNNALSTPKCITCRQRDADVVFLPCAHKLLCRQCAGSAKSCQECGMVVEGKIDIDGDPVKEAATPSNDPTNNTPADFNDACLGVLGNIEPQDLKNSSVPPSQRNVRDLFKALHSKNVELARRLLDRHPEIVRGKVTGDTPLHYAAMKGQNEAVRLLVARGGDVNEPDSGDNTPLMRATHRNHFETAKTLVQLGADVNKANNHMATPLHMAAMKENVDITRLLLQHKASVNIQAGNGYTPLHIALGKSGPHSAVAEALMSAEDLDLTLTSQEHANALHLACTKGKTRLVELILARNSSLVNTRMDARITPLHLAARKGNAEITRLLLRAQAAVDPQNNNGQTPLHAACYKDSAESAMILVEHGANVNATDKDGDTPLHYCVGIFTGLEQLLSGDKGLEMAKFLIQRGARTDLRNNKGQTALEMAQSPVKERLTRFLQERSQTPSNNPNTTKSSRWSTPSADSEATTKCVTCHHLDADVVFLPCAHKLVCRQCAGSTKNCRECGIVIQGKIDTDGNTVEQAPLPSTDQAPTKPNVDGQQDCKVQ